MLVLVTYDVNTSDKGGMARLRKVAKICENNGIRVQNSVFECNVDCSQFTILKNQLITTIDLKRDSIRFYSLGNKYKNDIEHYGVKQTYDMTDVIIV